MIKRFFVAVMAVSLISGTAHAATNKPSPTPTIKATAKATAKVTPKVTSKPTAVASSKPTSKVTAKTSATPTSKSTAKASATPTKKKVVYKPRPRKKVKVTPSPSAVWPPKGYVQSDDIYAKVPTSKELIGLASSNKTLAKSLVSCESLTCGAILATSSAGCNWWEFTADVTGPAFDTDKSIIKFGTLTSLFGPSKPKQVLPFIMISEEPVKDGHLVSNIKMVCHREAIPTDLKIPSNTYVKNN